ncbi:MAG: protein kinase [Planctomycetales bacterium]|nr:protein kinase [Planctomycetales bacterium]
MEPEDLESQSNTPPSDTSGSPPDQANPQRDRTGEGRQKDPNEETIQLDVASQQTTTDIPSFTSKPSQVSAGTGSGMPTAENTSKAPVEPRRNDHPGQVGDPSMETADEDAFHTDNVRPSSDPHKSSGFDFDDEAAEEIDQVVDRTLPNIDSTVDMGTVELNQNANPTLLDPPPAAARSVMNSSDISQTINPRELSKEDAAFWGSEAIHASKENKAEQTKLRPAVERSIAESKLQIRERDLAIPTRDKNSPSDYRLIRLLGRGGMGNVYVARQASLDRMIAVKVIKPLPKAKRQQLRENGRLEEVEYERRQQFLSEAVVTGDLDHPNIVPIHDIAVAADNTLFYAMKRVVGKPWLKSIDQKSRDENLEILLKVCDAIAFAHTRGVIHRDIKPENIMLGDFGEVLVMDWGLAIAKPEFEKRESITFTAGLGGTPAFMAPEMALGPVDSIGPHSDIYLLGATLFYIVVGYAPHKADNVSQCIRAVASNTIQEAAPEHRGELLDIALRAMATNPKERFESVQSFQQAIRSYRSHSESIAISSIAEKEYEKAIRTSRYESYSRASHGFEQAIALWSGNQSAIDSLDRCRIDHAQAAYQNGDYDLGLSLLSPTDSRHLELIGRLRDGLKLREQRAGRLKLFRGLAAAALGVILVGGSIAMYVINERRTFAEQQRQLAESRRIEAEQATGVAKTQTKIAEESTQLAKDRLVEVEQEKAEVERQKGIAEQNEMKATIAQKEAEENEQEAKRQEAVAKRNADEAERQRGIAQENESKAVAALQRAEYESYVSQIGLAKARIDRNEFDDARRILTSIRDLHPNQTPAWEWRYLWQQSHQSLSDTKFDAGVVDVAVGTTAELINNAFVVCSDGAVYRSTVGQDTQPTWNRHDLEATCVAISRDNRFLAIGTRRGGLIIADPENGHTIRHLGGHESTVTDADFLRDGRMLTASTDRTIALWNPEQRQRLSQCWHIAPVVAIAARHSGEDDTSTIVAGVSDTKTGRVVGWTLDRNQFSRIGVFEAHQSPIVSVALSEGGRLAGSGDSRGNVHLFRPADLQKTDFGNAIKNAISKIGDDSSGNGQLVASRLPSTPSISKNHWRAHPDAVSVMRFDDSKNMLLTGSDDYTISAWKVDDSSLQYSLRGHGGWVRALEVVPTGGSDHSGVLLSGSIDGTIRTWERPASFTTVSTDLPLLSLVDRSNGPQDGPDDNDGLQENQQRENQLHRDEILAARLDPSGTKLISASRDHTARILGIDRGTMSFREIARINTRQNSAEELSEGTEFLAMSAQLDSPGGRLFVGSADATIRIWDVESGTQLGSLRGTGLNNAFALSSDGRRLLSGSSLPDAKALLWSVDPNNASPTVLHRLVGHDQAVTAFATSSDGEVVVTGDRGGRCIVWNGSTGTPIGLPIDLFRGFRINELTISPDDRSLWVASDSGQLSEIILETRQPNRRLEHEGFVTAFSLAPRGDQAVTISAETTGKAFVTTSTWWDLTTLQSRQLHRVEAALDEKGQASGNNARITSARFGDRGNNLVICRQNKGGRVGRVQIIDLASKSSKSFDLPSLIGAPEVGLLLGRDRLITLNGEAAFRWSITGMVHEKSYRPHATVTDACFSPDGKVAATASRSLRLWRTESGEPLDKLESPHGGAITSLDFSARIGPAGYLFATSGNEAAARIWSWKNRESGFRLEQEMSIEDTEIQHARFTPDGTQLMLAGANGTVQIRSVVNGDVIFQWHLPNGVSTTCASFSADGKYLALGASDKTAWLIDTQTSNGTVPSVMTGHADRIESIAVLRDASNQIRVMTASRDKSARVWDPRIGSPPQQSPDQPHEQNLIVQGREILSLQRHTQGVTAIDCTSQGDLVMTAARDGKVLLWPAPIK